MARSTPGNAAADRLARLPSAIEARGVRHNNLRDLDVDIPLWCVVAVAGVSGSGKSSLATGTLYAEGMQRFLEGLSTYSRRRLSQAQRPDADRIDHLPAALALRQRPPIPGVRSTVGTMSEVLNVLRLIMSRLGTHICPNGHPVAPTVSTQGMEMTCPVCGVRFTHPGAESFAFNSYGACPACNGTGELFQVDVDTLVPDEDKSINDGAVLSWNSGGRRLYRYAAGELGVRLDVPFRELTERERDIVFHGEPVEREVRLRAGTPRAITLNVHYENAVAAVEHAAGSDSPGGRSRVEKFLKVGTCPVCHGTRLNPEALRSTLDGRNLAEISALDLEALRGFVEDVRKQAPKELARVSNGLVKECLQVLDPLLQLGLGYLQLDRAGSTLSTGERQRLELTSTVRANTTGMLYVLDEPSVGLHPSNIEGLRSTIGMLAANGNSVVMVEHEIEVINAADWVIELGPGAGEHGGTVVAQGTPADIRANKDSVIGPFLAGEPAVRRAAPAGRRRRGHRRGRRPLQPARRPRLLPRARDDRGGRAVRCGQDRPGPGEPGARAARQPGRREDAQARPAAGRRRDPRAGRDRRDPDRPELPARRRRRTRAPSTRSGRRSRTRPWPAAAAGSPGTSPSTPRPASAPSARAWACRHRRAVPARHPRGLPALPRLAATGRRCSTSASTS